MSGTAIEPPGEAPPPPPVAQRLAAAGFCALSLLVVAAATSSFLSSLYASAAADVVLHSNGRTAAADAAVAAVALAPWRSMPRRNLAQSLSAAGQIEAAIEQGKAAVRTNPADGYAWAYLARLTTAVPPLGSDVVSLYQMALARRPDTPALHQAVALDGVVRWRSGDTALRELWRSSMEYTLRDDRKPFLVEIVRMKRDRAWCAAQRDHLPIEQWCANMERVRVECDRPDLAPKALAWCRNLGMGTRP